MASKWIPTACGMCYAKCGILVCVEDGVVTAIEGNPNNPQNRGSMCAKGKAGPMNLYNPNRVKAPLKRTNPKKGLHIQAWESTGDFMHWLSALGSAFGTPHILRAASPTCGKVVHPVEFFSGGGFHQQPDLHRCNYCLLVGTQFAIAARGSFNHIALDMAEARERGMKLVVVDPVGGNAASKADEWVPIRPGTDSAFALSLLHVLLNELGLYDAKFLQHKTNAPYLVGSDGRYVRDPKSGKPMIYDTADRKT